MIRSLRTDQNREAHHKPPGQTTTSFTSTTMSSTPSPRSNSDHDRDHRSKAEDHLPLAAHRQIWQGLFRRFPQACALQHERLLIRKSPRQTPLAPSPPLLFLHNMTSLRCLTCHCLLLRPCTQREPQPAPSPCPCPRTRVTFGLEERHRKGQGL